MITWCPASANRRARPRPWSPVPPRMPMTSPSTDGVPRSVMVSIFSDDAPGPSQRAVPAGSQRSRLSVRIWLRGGVFPMHHRYVDANQVTTLRALLAPTGWLERTRAFAQGLRKATRSPGGFLLVGTPDEEPWHLTAHLDEESRLGGIPELMPTLVRWQVPEGAPEHLRVGLARLEEARRGESLLVVSPQAAPDPLLERVSDARKSGATILALDRGDRQLDGLA